MLYRGSNAFFGLRAAFFKKNSGCGRIYPTLRTLEQKELVTKRSEKRSGEPSRKT
ncbi:hypothetical protein CDO73_11785 [Saccharibacillus sp. O23]|nr:hypothetical protein CDO73_11785 [Saccharibacillus sp. O23]